MALTAKISTQSDETDELEYLGKLFLDHNGDIDAEALDDEALGALMSFLESPMWDVNIGDWVDPIENPEPWLRALPLNRANAYTQVELSE